MTHGAPDHDTVVCAGCGFWFDADETDEPDGALWFCLECVDAHRARPPRAQAKKRLPTEGLAERQAARAEHNAARAAAGLPPALRGPVPARASGGMLRDPAVLRLVLESTHYGSAVRLARSHLRRGEVREALVVLEECESPMERDDPGVR